MDIRNREIGRRVNYWRTRRNLTRQQLADKVGRSVSWVDKIEAGERALLRLPMLERVADALDVDVAVLTDDERAWRSRQCPDAAEVLAIRAALGSYETLLGRSGSSSPDAPDLGRLRQQVGYACTAWLSSHFTTMGRVLPGLILDAQRAVAAYGGDGQLEATRHLVMTYRLASSTLLKFETTDVAWLAADRAITVASGVGDTVCLARATRSVARAMTESGQRREAIDVLVGMAERMEPELSAGDRELTSLYGMLLLPAEIAAARDGNADVATTMHEQALSVARTLGSTFSDRVTAFGITNVELHRLAALVRLHDGGRALEFARTIDPAGLVRLPNERKVNYLIDMAEANQQCGRLREAASALVDAERVAPEEVRCRPVARTLIRGLLDSATGHPARELRNLAHRVGLPA
jgi:transcriptional regulator with XRE-family HTH domain